MSRSEQIQCLVSALLVTYPLLFMILRQEYLLARIGDVSAIRFFHLLRQLLLPTQRRRDVAKRDIDDRAFDRLSGG